MKNHWMLATVCLSFFLYGCASKNAAAPAATPNEPALIQPLDQAKSMSAQSMLNADTDLGPLHLRVRVVYDTATLEGSVDNEAEKEKAETLVKSVSGIEKVDNRLVVGH